MGLAAPLRNFVAAKLDAIWGAASLTPPARFASRADEAEKRAKRSPHFAKRNEAFRRACRKSLESLGAPNQALRGIVCFQRLSSIFISPH
jgi:hypothetical protein